MLMRTKAELETELYGHLQTARQELQNATDTDVESAKEHYRRVLSQFNQLVLYGTVPRISSNDGRIRQQHLAG